MTPPTRVGPYLLMCAVAAALLSLTRIQQLQDADSVLFQLVSRHHWMPFFWEQDRVGMLWPLLAKPIENPFANLITQSAIMIFCGLAFPFVIVRTLDKHVPTLPFVVTNVWLIAWAPDIVLQNWFIVCQYPSALFLAGCGLLCFEDFESSRWRNGRLLAGLMLLVLAHWVYVAVIFVVGPLALMNVLRTRQLGSRWALFMTIVSLIIGYGLMIFVRGRYPAIDVTPTKFNSITSIPGHMFEFLNHPIRPQYRATMWFFTPLIAGGLALFVSAFGHFGSLASLRFWFRQTLLLPCLLLLLGLIELVMASLFEWPCTMDHHPRYILFSLTAMQLFGAWLITDLLKTLGRDLLFRITCIAGLTFVSVVYLKYGVPSPVKVRLDFHDRFGRHTEAILQSGADAVCAEYWELWPAVFHVEWTKYERGEPPLNNAVGLRSSAYWRSWQAAGTDGFLVAVPKPGPADAVDLGRERGLARYEFVREDDKLTIYRTRIVFRPFPGKPLP